MIDVKPAYNLRGFLLTRTDEVGNIFIYVNDALGRSKNHRWEKFTTQALGVGTLLMGYETQAQDGESLYDRAGNKLITYRTHEPSRSEMYSYDSMGRLSGRGATLPYGAAFQRGTFGSERNTMDPAEGGMLDYYQEWNLDGLGNWTAFNDNNPTPATRTHSEYNEIVAASGSTFVHDKNGNLTDDGVNTYQWDAFGRLRKITRKSDSVVLGEFRYDAQNRRVYHTAPFADSSTYGNTRRYVYNGAQMFTEYFNAYGSGEAMLEYFIYGTYLDEVWARQRMIPNGQGGYNPQYLFFHHDPLFSVCGVTDTTGNLFEAYEYDPYGNRIVITDGPDPDALVNFTSDDLRGATSPLFIKPAFTGQRFDQESGLYYYKERYYHPGWGRFINRDPMKINDIKDKYEYVGSNPINLIDPFGLWYLPQQGKLGGKAWGQSP
jgi:RHS repeat-associated protein